MVGFPAWLGRHAADRYSHARIKGASAARSNGQGGGAGRPMDHNRAQEPFSKELHARIPQEPAAGGLAGA